jgi:hypothetical protein
MTLSSIRRWSRLIAVCLLLAGGRLPHAAADDPACLPGAAQLPGDHDETKHGLRAPAADHEEHCAVCHWTRSLRAPRTEIRVASAPVHAASLLARPAVDSRLHPSLPNLPPRAPPSELL